jgi:hypothetical protein
MRDRIDVLLRKNPQYMSWGAGVPAADKKLTAFVNAATWPDCIKQAAKCPGYTADGTNNGETAPAEPEASRNIGYTDKDMHKYWHYIDEPFSTPGVLTTDPQSANALAEITIFTTAIGSSESDGIKSYDLAWIEHLVGDVHQPLHATSRFTKAHLEGDNGGNLVKFCVSPCRDNLHSYWDDLQGTSTTLTSIRNLGNKLLMAPKPQRATVTDVNTWVMESFALAKKFAYAAPISTATTAGLSPRPDQQYHDAAQKIAEQQVLLAGYRLAALLNAHLK